MSDIFSLFASVGNNLSNNENDVMNVKKELFKRGYYTKPVENGIIDVDTTNAIKSFQKNNNLKVDGIMNPGGETENAIKLDLGYDNTDRARRNQIVNNAHDFNFHVKSDPYYKNTLEYIGSELEKGVKNIFEINSFSPVKENSSLIEETSKKIGTDPELVKSIMHIENSRGYRDFFSFACR